MRYLLISIVSIIAINTESYWTDALALVYYWLTSIALIVFSIAIYLNSQHLTKESIINVIYNDIESAENISNISYIKMFYNLLITMVVVYSLVLNYYHLTGVLYFIAHCYFLYSAMKFKTKFNQIIYQHNLW